MVIACLVALGSVLRFGLTCRYRKARLQKRNFLRSGQRKSLFLKRIVVLETNRLVRDN